MAEQCSLANINIICSYRSCNNHQDQCRNHNNNDNNTNIYGGRPQSLESAFHEGNNLIPLSNPFTEVSIEIFSELLNHWEKHKDAPKYSPFITQPIPLPPKKVEKATQRTSTFARARPPKRITFRTTTIKSGYQPRIRTRQLSEPRASSNEYHAFDGIPFPPSTGELSE